MEGRRYCFLGRVGRIALLILLAGAAMAQGAASLHLDKTEPWTPTKIAAPVARRGAESFTIEANGTPTCCGGWQFVYSGVEPGQAYRIQTRVKTRDLVHPDDNLVGIAMWGRWNPNQAESGQTPWNYLLPSPTKDGAIDLSATITAPAGASALTVRYTFRWAARGGSEWTLPRIESVTAAPKKPVKIAVITQTRQTAKRIKPLPLSAGLGLSKELGDSVDLWGTLALEACKRQPDLILTPEVVVKGKDMEASPEIPGPATRPFEEIARKHNVWLVVGMKERKGNAYYNSAVLIGPPGKVYGVYHKVHLATSEGISGLSPGDDFPVFETPLGRIGCEICMDTTVCESARMLALNGADFICFPVMGDLRADRWSAGGPIFSEDRWKAIMRTRAIDNQVCMVIARNEALGSCIINRKGDILAWNEGDQEVIDATLPANDGFMTWDGGDFRETTFMLRRPHIYEAYTQPFNMKPLEGTKH